MNATRTAKAETIKRLEETVGRAPYAFLIDYKGLTVPAVTDLRRQIRGTGSKYVVVKNTLARRALKGKPLGELAEHFTGMTAVAFSQTDVVALARVLHTFGKSNPAVRVRAALLEGKAVPAASLETLATMPSRQELLARLVGLLKSPVRRLVTALSTPQRNLAATIAAVARNRETAS